MKRLKEHLTKSKVVPMKLQKGWQKSKKICPRKWKKCALQTTKKRGVETSSGHSGYQPTVATTWWAIQLFLMGQDWEGKVCALLDLLPTKIYHWLLWDHLAILLRSGKCIGWFCHLLGEEDTYLRGGHGRLQRVWTVLKNIETVRSVGLCSLPPSSTALFVLVYFSPDHLP